MKSMVGAEQFLYDVFLKQFEDKRIGMVGAEVEMPVVRTVDRPYDREEAMAVLASFLEDGFRVEETDGEGNPAFLINDDGDVLSFDNSCYNFEISLQYGDNLCTIAKRYEKLFSMAKERFLASGYDLLGRGTHPHAPHLPPAPVSFPVYGMVKNFLHRYQNENCHSYPEFPAYLSSVQTHLDIDLHALPKALTVFSMLDFARALLFANSPDFARSGVLCYRDELWQRSAFSVTGNVGTPDSVYKKPEDIVCDIGERTMFHRIRNGSYEIFDPIPCADYFREGNREDISCYLSFCNVEVTRRGTLEIRSDCKQPHGEDFVPCAFHLGLLYGLDEAKKLTKDFLCDQGIDAANSELRALAVSGQPFPADPVRLSEYLLRLSDLAAEGLRSRGRSEEALLRPIYRRASELTNPAKEEYETR